MKHLMLDLETWGTVPGCGIRSIGAVIFDATQLGQEFYLNILDHPRLHKDPQTVAWWAGQSLEAQTQLLDEQHELTEAVRAFHEYVKDHRPDYVWCHGACFDEPIWRYAATMVLKPVPWRYNVRCTRTLYDTIGFNPKTIQREGVHHNALDDAKYQARCVQAAWLKSGYSFGPSAISSSKSARDSGQEPDNTRKSRRR